MGDGRYNVPSILKADRREMAEREWIRNKLGIFSVCYDRPCGVRLKLLALSDELGVASNCTQLEWTRYGVEVFEFDYS